MDTNTSVRSVKLGVVPNLYPHSEATDDMESRDTSDWGELDNGPRDVEHPGYISNHLEELEGLDSTFLETYLDLAEFPWSNGPLDPVVKEFVLIAVSSATTAFDEQATREHIGRALDRGATFEEVLEVLELTSILGMHSATEGIPIVMEEADLEPPDLDKRDRLLDELEDHRDFFSEVWEDVEAIVEADPDYWSHLFEFLRHPYDDAVLEPKTMEFVYIAIDAGTSHLFRKGLRVHIRNALMLGASPEEIVEVIELASASGIHSVAEGLPLLVQEAADREALPEALEGHRSTE